MKAPFSPYRWLLSSWNMRGMWWLTWLLRRCENISTCSRWRWIWAWKWLPTGDELIVLQLPIKIRFLKVGHFTVTCPLCDVTLFFKKRNKAKDIKDGLISGLCFYKWDTLIIIFTVVVITLVLYKEGPPARIIEGNIKFLCKPHSIFVATMVFL